MSCSMNASKTLNVSHLSSSLCKQTYRSKEGLFTKINFAENLVDWNSLIQSVESRTGFFPGLIAMPSQAWLLLWNISPTLVFFQFSQWLFQDLLKHLCAHDLPFYGLCNRSGLCSEQMSNIFLLLSEDWGMSLFSSQGQSRTRLNVLPIWHH